MKKLFIIFAVLCLAAPSMAADWNFYGSARFATFWTDLDGDTNAERDDDEGLQWEQNVNSRIGATIQFNDEIGGGFEYGHDTSENNVGLRKMFGTYTFGAGQLLIGQTYTPSNSFYSDSVFDGDGDLLGVGQFYIGRVPMVQWKMGGFKLALIKPNTGADAISSDNDDAFYSYYDADGDLQNLGQLDEDQLELATDAIEAAEGKEVAATVFQTVGPTGVVTFDDVDVTFPKIEVSYGFKADMFFADVFAGYQTYELESDQTTKTQDVDSYVLGGGVGVNFGGFYAKIGAHIGQNLGNYGAYDPTYGDQLPELDDDFTVVGGNEKDADGLGYLAVVGFTLSEIITFEGGYGHEEAEVDDSSNTQERDQWYVNANINIARGFFIVPEVGMITFSQDAKPEEPELFYAGAKWQINF